MWNQLLKIGSKAVNELKWGAKLVDKKRDEIFGTAGPDSWERKTNDAIQQFVDYTPIGVAERGAVILGGNVAETVGLPREAGEFVGGALAPGLAGPPKPPVKGLSSAQLAATKIKIKDNVKGVVDDLTAPPTRPTPQLATAGAGASTPAFGAPKLPQKGLPKLDLTIKNPDFIARGVQQGSASGPDFGPAMTKWRNRRMELREQMRNPSGNTPHRRQQNARGSKEVAYNDVSTGPTTDPLDVVAYGRGAHKVKGKQQHHLFPKQESYQFVERMNEIGDQDDVLNLFLYAEEVDATMGGRLSDILNMDTKPHTKLHSNRVKDGRQLGSIKMGNLVRSAKSTDELMTLFNRYVTENIKPSKAEARKLQQAFEQAKGKQKRFNSLTIKDRQRL